MVEAYRRHLGSSTFHTYAFCYFLYPVHNVVLCCTIFVPIALAIERFRAIRYNMSSPLLMTLAPRSVL
jgi:hypothetical protein